MFGTNLEINGRQYTLKIDINAIIDMKSKGVDVASLDQTEMGDFEFLRTIFFFALQKYHKKEVKTELVAGDLMSEYLDLGGDFTDLSQAIVKTISRAFGSKHAAKIEEDIQNQIAVEEAKGK